MLLYGSAHSQSICRGSEFRQLWLPIECNGVCVCVCECPKWGKSFSLNARILSHKFHTTICHTLSRLCVKKMQKKRKQLIEALDAAPGKRVEIVIGIYCVWFAGIYLLHSTMPTHFNIIFSNLYLVKRKKIVPNCFYLYMYIHINICFGHVLWLNGAV